MTPGEGGVLPTPELIARKRDGGALTGEEIGALVTGYLAGDVGEEQMAALLMAGVIRGFDDAEAVAFTETFVASGDVIDLGQLRGPTVDKHSTGGVGDTTTLVVAPLLAAAGLQVAKLSGRGLGHTGGTLDKLEAIPGFRVDLDADEFAAQVDELGLAVAAATADLVPADKRIYALRDVTGTVPSPALIAASVMSKKIAGGADTIVLDVKTGDGAFMEDVAAAQHLGELCVRIGDAHGRTTGALVTDMSQPLGDAIGNAVEVAAAVDVLHGGGSPRLRELSLALAAAAIELTATSGDESPRARATRLLDDGVALERFAAFVAAQGGDATVAERPREVLERAPVQRPWRPADGTVTAIRCRRLGEIASRLGAGRVRRGAEVDPAVGLEVAVRVGDDVTADTTAVTIHARSDVAADEAARALDDAIVTGTAPASSPPLIHRRIGVGAG